MDSFTARVKHHITQPQLAALMGVHVNSISRWETGETVPDRYQLKMLQIIHDTSKADIQAAIGDFLTKGVFPWIVRTPAAR